MISYLLRQRGGRWASADLEGETVEAIRAVVETDVHQLSDGAAAPFADDEFDRVVIIDYLEHVQHDRPFIHELGRIVKPGGRILINVPHHKESALRRLRLAIGQTDEEHGHVRPGYTLEALRDLLDGEFVIETHNTYSRFFSELVDTIIRFGVSIVKGGGQDSPEGQEGPDSRYSPESSEGPPDQDSPKQLDSPKGQIVTGQDLHANRILFRIYSILYPFVSLVSKLDQLLFFTDGYMLILRARKA